MNYFLMCYEVWSHNIYFRPFPSRGDARFCRKTIFILRYCLSPLRAICCINPLIFQYFAALWKLIFPRWPRNSTEIFFSGRIFSWGPFLEYGKPLCSGIHAIWLPLLPTNMPMRCRGSHVWPFVLISSLKRSRPKGAHNYDLFCGFGPTVRWCGDVWNPQIIVSWL